MWHMLLEADTITAEGFAMTFGISELYSAISHLANGFFEL